MDFFAALLLLVAFALAGWKILHRLPAADFAPVPQQTVSPKDVLSAIPTRSLPSQQLSPDGALWLLPVLVGLALLTWVAGLLESNNLWDYLIDPWLATAALFHCIKWGVASGPACFRRSGAGRAG